MMKAGQPKRFCLGPTLSSAGLNPYRLTARPYAQPPAHCDRRTQSCICVPSSTTRFAGRSKKAVADWALRD